jgi:uncharacterized membrane protein YfcA
MTASPEPVLDGTPPSTAGLRMMPTVRCRDIQRAGSLSLAASLPTMLIGFARYSRDRSLAVLGENCRFVLVMAAGSIVGSFIGGRVLGLVPNAPCCLCAR